MLWLPFPPCTVLKFTNVFFKVTEEELKKKFGEKGQVTDVQLKYTKNGKFRHFAFVGFQNESEADTAIQHFNQSFFNSLRITVERCAELGKNGGYDEQSYYERIP